MNRLIVLFIKFFPNNSFKFELLKSLMHKLELFLFFIILEPPCTVLCTLDVYI